MIIPERITKFDRTEEELQEFLLFCVMVHGKKASVQARKLHCFLEYLAHWAGEPMPFKLVNMAMNYDFEPGEAPDGDPESENMLLYALKKFGLGQYNRIFWAIDDFLRLPSLKEVTLEQLEKCYAVGPKSARFFLVHSRPQQKLAILDTHILKWLSLQGIQNVPKNTPQGRLYSHFEKTFLTIVEKSGLSVAEFDLNVWKSYAQ